MPNITYSFLHLVSCSFGFSFGTKLADDASFIGTVFDAPSDHTVVQLDLKTASLGWVVDLV